MEGEELYGLAELEVVVGGLVVGVAAALSVHLHAELVERVVVAAAHAQGQPRIAAGHQPLYAAGLLGLPEGLFLLLILHLQQHALPLQFQYG